MARRPGKVLRKDLRDTIFLEQQRWKRMIIPNTQRYVFKDVY